jgi:hypothetical protein
MPVTLLGSPELDFVHLEAKRLASNRLIGLQANGSKTNA